MSSAHIAADIPQGLFLDDWCAKTMRAKIEPMKKLLECCAIIGACRAIGFGP